FVDVPRSRFAAPTFPPSHKLRRPPSLRLSAAPKSPPPPIATDPRYFGALPYERASSSSHTSPRSSSDTSSCSIDSNVYLIDNASHLSNLLTIVASSTSPCRRPTPPSPPRPSPSSPPASFRVVRPSAPSAPSAHALHHQHLGPAHSHMAQPCLERFRYQDAPSDSDYTTRTCSPCRSSQCDQPSSTSITDLQPLFRPPSQCSLSQVRPPTPPISPRTQSYSSASSASSFRAPSPDVCTVTTLESNDHFFRAASRSHSPLITRVDSLYSANHLLHPNRNLMCHNPPSPTKYTFKPTYRHSSPHVSSPSLSLQQSTPLFDTQRHTAPINPPLSSSTHQPSIVLIPELFSAWHSHNRSRLQPLDCFARRETARALSTPPPPSITRTTTPDSSRRNTACRLPD
ncbi:unnamed protein product, partial [Agarophyton chilense]